MTAVPQVRLKRVYEPVDLGDGARFLVERLWPRGLRREAVHLTAWLKDVAPSPELRRWFHHEPARWEEFRRRYRAELAEPAKQALVQELVTAARAGPITLVFAARDTEHNAAVVLKELIEELAAAGEASR
ncbi:MAG: DUF488 domain-containing protein [Chloroflexota bacterium]